MSGPVDFPRGAIALSRDCPAVLIPGGEVITLEVGTEVIITQALGGSVTVNAAGNLLRIQGRDLDALGMSPVILPAEQAEAAADGSVDLDLVWAQLRTCYDPEIPIDVVELGLIYRCDVRKLPDGRNQVWIEMTLTAPGCGMGPILIDDVQRKVLQVPNVDEVDVELVFEPFWTPDMMSEAARLQTGLY